MPITITSVRPDLPSQSMCSTTGACQACGGGGVALPSLAKVTWIFKQYQVSWWSDISLLTGDQDGEHDGALHDTSVSLGSFWPLSAARVLLSIWAVVPDFWQSWSLNQATKDAELLTVSWNFWISPLRLGTKDYARKLRNNRACGSCAQFIVS